MGQGGAGAGAVEGAWTAGLTAVNKMALLATPGVFEQYIWSVDLAAAMLREGLIDEELYDLCTWKDPVFSAARQVHRVGTTSWAREIYKNPDRTAALAAASMILGVDEGRNPVWKRDYGVDDRALHEMVSKPEMVRAGRKLAPYEAPLTNPDGVSLHRDVLKGGAVGMAGFGVVREFEEVALRKKAEALKGMNRGVARRGGRVRKVYA